MLFTTGSLLSRSKQVSLKLSYLRANDYSVQRVDAVLAHFDDLLRAQGARRLTSVHQPGEIACDLPILGRQILRTLNVLPSERDAV